MRSYPYSTIEEKFSGTEIEITKKQGWTFAELETTAGTYGKELTQRQTEVEALKLLAVFIQHADRKAEQQRLVCPEDQVDLTRVSLRKAGEDEIYDETKSGACQKPQMLIQDPGASFGGFTKISMTVAAKMSLKHWNARPIFNEELYQKTFDKQRGSGVCKGDMRISLKAGGEKGRPHPLIREEGRRMLGELLSRFQKAGKVRDLFVAANANALANEHSIYDEKTKAQLRGVDAWVSVFNRKVDEVLNHRCCIPDASGKKCAD